MRDDLSLIKLCNRLAVEGEELVAHRFSNHAVRMVSQTAYCRWKTAVKSAAKDSEDTGRSAGLWQSIKAHCVELLTYYGFLDTASRSRSEPGPVIGIPSEALLRVYGISQELQDQFGLQAAEDALFTELTAPACRRCDAICFGNGVTISLQLLCEGQRVKVIRRSWADSIEHPAPEPVHVNV